MDPVQQTLAQQTSGSAEGQGFGQYFVQGQQTSLSKRKLDLEAQQQQFDQQRQSMLLPLQAEALRLHNTNTGIEVAANREKWEAMTQQNALLPEIFKLQAAFAQSPQGYGDQNLINQAEELASKKPTAFAAGPGAELLTNIRAIPMMRQKFDEVRRFNKDLSGTGEMVSEITDKGGIHFGRATTGAQPGELSPVGKLLQDKQFYENKGDTKSVDALNKSIEHFQGSNGAYAPSNLQKDLDVADKLGIKYSPDEMRSIVDVHLGIKPKSGTDKQKISKPDFIAKAFPKAREGAKDKTPDSDIVRQLGTLYDSIYVPTESPLKVGEMRKGYKFNGNFPAWDKRAWDKAE